MQTTGAAFLEALHDWGVHYIFANLGSDHTALIEAMAGAPASGLRHPRLLTCPNEMVALAAAHGYALVSGRAQAVVVHVDCGTQALGGAVHNAAKGRVPVLIFAGTSPITQEGEARGSRNEFIHWIQDVADQRGLVRGYVRYENEIRTGANVKQLVSRAMQFAHSDPKGPVYLTATREIMESESPAVRVDTARWPPVAPAALPAGGVELLASALARARRPLVVTSYLGRNTAAVDELVRLARRLGAGVLESVPACVNYPGDDPLYQGNQWNEKRQNRALAEADVVLVIDSDVPWIPLHNRPAPGATLFHIDLDPLKQQMPLWYLQAHHVFRADGATALRQINEWLDTAAPDEAAVRERTGHYQRRHAERARELRESETPQGNKLTPEYLTACVREAIGPEAIVMSEGVTNFPVIADHSGRTRPGTLFTAAAGSLGWSGGAALGAKLCNPDALVVAMTGDGSYMFSIPSTVHWMARRYGTPFLQIIFNNSGWAAPRFSALGVHPDGFTSRTEDIGTSFDPAPDYGAIAAAAGGAHAQKVRTVSEVKPALERALDAIRRERRCAVIDAILDPT